MSFIMNTTLLNKHISEETLNQLAGSGMCSERGSRVSCLSHTGDIISPDLVQSRANSAAVGPVWKWEGTHYNPGIDRKFLQEFLLQISHLTKY